MNSFVKTAGVLLVCGVFLSACTQQESNAKSATAEVSSNAVDKKAYGLYTDEDLKVATKDDAATTIKLANDQTTVEGNGAKVDGQTVTITEGGTYVVSGELTEGAIKIAGDKTKDQVNVVFDGVTVTNANDAPIFVESAKKVVVSLSEGSNNIITDNRDEAADETTTDDSSAVEVADAAIYSKADLTFNGTGKLTVVGKMKDGIRSKDRLTMVSGSYDIQAANNGLKGKDSVSVLDGDYTIKAENDGIQADNTKDDSLGWVAIDGGKLTVTAEHDGIQGETDVKVSQGTVNLVTGGGAAKAEKKQEEEPPGGGMMGAEPGAAGAGGTPPEMPAGEEGLGSQPADANNSQTTTESTTNETADTAKTATEAAAEEASSSDSAKGIKAGQSVIITDGTFELDTKDDGLHSNGDVTIDGGTLTIATGDDGIHADNNATINNGKVTVSESYEGLEGAVITVAGGEIDLTASDDGVNASAGTDTSKTAELNISGGQLKVNATGDGLDSNGDVNLTGGTVLVDGPTSGGDGALDYDGTFNQTGGTLIATGSQGMAQATSDSSSQPGVAVYFDDSQKANTLVNIQDDSGKTIATYSPSKTFEWVFISTPELSKGDTYKLSTGGADTGKNNQGLYEDSQYTGGTSFSVKLNDVITGVSDSGDAVTVSQEGMPGGGGFGQGGPGQTPEAGTDTTTGASGTAT